MLSVQQTQAHAVEPDASDGPDNERTHRTGDSDGSTVAVLSEFLASADALGTAHVMIDSNADTGIPPTGSRVSGCVFVAVDPRSANAALASSDETASAPHVGGEGEPSDERARPRSDATAARLAVAANEPVQLASLADFEKRFPAVAPDLREAGLESVACLPVVTPDGTAIGVVGVASPAPVHFDDTLRATLAELVSQTLEHAALTQAQERAATRATELARVTARLASARTVDEVTAAVIAEAPAVIDAAALTLAIIDGHDSDLNVVGSTFADGTSAANDDRTFAQSPPVVDAMRSGTAVHFDDMTELARLYPDRTAVSARAGAAGWWPLTASDDRTVGVIAVEWSPGSQPDRVTRATSDTLALMIGQAVERALFTDSEHRFVQQLQEQLLTTPSAPLGYTIAARYQAAISDMGMGGDWYDTVHLPDGSFAAVVGDVAGHGTTAAVEMAQLRSTVHALLAAGIPLPTLLQHTVWPWSTMSMQASTMVVAVVRSDSTVSYVAAGHPYPMMRSPNGEITVLTEGRGSVLGFIDGPITPGTAPFPPGSILVLYSDGLVERRGKSLHAGFDCLADGLRTCREDWTVHQVADHLIETCNAEASEDDIALIVLKRDT